MNNLNKTSYKENEFSQSKICFLFLWGFNKSEQPESLYGYISTAKAIRMVLFFGITESAKH